MSNLLQFPNKRKTINSIGNPIFVDDLVIAEENLQNAITQLIGQTTGFYILTGFTHSQTVFTPGYFWADGQVYYSNNNVTLGKYLAPNPTDALSREFSDTNTYATYQVQYATESATQYSHWPQMTPVNVAAAKKITLSELKADKLDTADLPTYLSARVPAIIATTPAWSELTPLINYWTGNLYYMQDQTGMIHMRTNNLQHSNMSAGVTCDFFSFPNNNLTANETRRFAGYQITGITPTNLCITISQYLGITSIGIYTNRSWGINDILAFDLNFRI